MRTLLSVPWDVPVRLVAGMTVEQERTIRHVDPGAELPGITALRVTLRRSGARLLLVRIEPDGSERRARATSLVTLLDDLRAVDDGTIGVLVDGTPFTHAVLQALLRVPSGARTTYTGLARVAGRPRAVRAAASVLARNRVPLVLPCHRVVPSSGGTGRYAWGEAVKGALLDHEAARTAVPA